MEFTRYGLDVYTSEVDDKGIDFVVCTLEPRKHFDIQVKSVRELHSGTGSFNYVSFRKEHFEPKNNLFAVVALFIEGEFPGLYLIASTAWLEPKPPLVSHDSGSPRTSDPEWGINLSQRNLQLLETFAFDKAVKLLH